MSLFSATNQERTYEQLLHNWVILKCRTYTYSQFIFFSHNTARQFTYKPRGLQPAVYGIWWSFFLCFYCQYLCSNPLLRGSALLFNFLSPDKEFSNMFVPEKVGDKAGKIALTFFVLLLNRWVSQKTKHLPMLFIFSRSCDEMAKESYILECF